MASDVEIANAALIKVGDDRITSFDDPSKAARLIKARYAMIREAELRSHDWSFAMKRAKLPALVAAPSWGFARQFQLPTDFLRLNRINGTWLPLGLNDYKTDEEQMYAIEAGKILTDLSAPLEIRYVYKVEDPAQFDAMFVEAFACRLAMELAEPLTQSNSKRQLAADAYSDAIAAAKRANAIEKPPVDIPDDTWVLSRL